MTRRKALVAFCCFGLLCIFIYATLFRELDRDAADLEIINDLSKYDRSHVFNWQVFTWKNVYDVESRSPRTGWAGGLDVDLMAVLKAASSQLNKQRTGTGAVRRPPYTPSQFLDGRYRHVPGRGTVYVVNFPSRTEAGRVETARLVRQVGPLRAAFGPSNSAQLVCVVVPYYFRPDAFGAFMANVEHLVLKRRERLELVVVFYWSGVPAAVRGEVARDLVRVRGRLEQLNHHAGRRVAWLIEARRPFSRGHALLSGGAAGRQGEAGSNPLLFFCDIDMFFDEAMLRRCRVNTSPGRSVYYPIVFSTFSPALRSHAWGQRPTSLWEKHPIDEQVGFWRDFGYGMTCQYWSDFTRTAGSYLVSNSWGEEDLKLFQKQRKSGIEIVRAPDPGLVHVYHGKMCDRRNLGGKYSACLGSMLHAEASQGTWARWAHKLHQLAEQPQTLHDMLQELGRPTEPGPADTNDHRNESATLDTPLMNVTAPP